MEKDLTVGNPQTVLWKFCLPLFGSIVFQQLYNIADSLVAGKFVGENALAAVGNSYEITLIFIAFAFGCNIGCSVIVSQLFGAKRIADMKTAVHTALIASAVVCAVLMAVGLAFGTDLLRAINTPEEVMADSALYLDIYVYGLPFVFFYNVATGIFSALGDSKTPFIFLACSSTSNILVDHPLCHHLRHGGGRRGLGRPFCARASAAYWRCWWCSGGCAASRRRKRPAPSLCPCSKSSRSLPYPAFYSRASSPSATS